MRRASLASRLSSPAIRAVMPDASLEVFSISSDSINVMFFHEPNQSSAPLHTFATCLYQACRVGCLCFSDQSWHICKSLAAIALSKPLGFFFCQTDYTLSILLSHFKLEAPFLQNQTTAMWSQQHAGNGQDAVNIVQRNCKGLPGGVSWLYTCPNATVLKSEA